MISRLWTSGLLAATLLTAAPHLAPAAPNCTCRFAGSKYQLGQYACIRGKLAQCQMVLNNTAWQQVAETCPQASRQPTSPPMSRPTAFDQLPAGPELAGLPGRVPLF